MKHSPFCAPYYVYIQDPGCGGTVRRPCAGPENLNASTDRRPRFPHLAQLIAPNLVLTAAHCLPRKPSKLKGNTVLIGGNQFNLRGNKVLTSCCPFGAVETKIRKAIPHPDYGRIINDLAVLEVDPVDPKYTVCPSPTPLSVGDDTMAMGLGDTSSGGTSGEYPEWLQFGHHEIYPPSVCAYYKEFEGIYGEGPLKDYYLCAAGNWHYGTPGQADPEDYRYICYGDSGTGLMKRRGDLWDVGGVVSWGDTLNGRGCGVYPESFVNLHHPESISFIKSRLRAARSAAGMAQCPGW